MGTLYRGIRRKLVQSKMLITALLGIFSSSHVLASPVKCRPAIEFPTTSIPTTTEYQPLFKMKWLENLDQIELKLAKSEEERIDTTTSTTSAPKTAPDSTTLPIF